MDTHAPSTINDINFCYSTQKLSFLDAFITFSSFFLVPYCHTSQHEQVEKSPHGVHSISTSNKSKLGMRLKPFKFCSQKNQRMLFAH